MDFVSEPSFNFGGYGQFENYSSPMDDMGFSAMPKLESDERQLQSQKPWSWSSAPQQPSNGFSQAPLTSSTSNSSSTSTFGAEPVLDTDFSYESPSDNAPVSAGSPTQRFTYMDDNEEGVFGSLAVKSEPSLAGQPQESSPFKLPTLPSVKIEPTYASSTMDAGSDLPEPVPSGYSTSKSGWSVITESVDDSRTQSVSVPVAVPQQQVPQAMNLSGAASATSGPQQQLSVAQFEGAQSIFGSGPILVPPYLYIGNVYEKRSDMSADDPNAHQWALFVSVAPDIQTNDICATFIEKMSIELRANSTISSVVVSRPPFAVKGQGCGQFTAVVGITFKPEAGKRSDLIVHHQINFSQPVTSIAYQVPGVDNSTSASSASSSKASAKKASKRPQRQVKPSTKSQQSKAAASRVKLEDDSDGPEAEDMDSDADNDAPMRSPSSESDRSYGPSSRNNSKSKSPERTESKRSTAGGTGRGSSRKQEEEDDRTCFGSHLDKSAKHSDMFQDERNICSKCREAPEFMVREKRCLRIPEKMLRGNVHIPKPYKSFFSLASFGPHKCHVRKFQDMTSTGADKKDMVLLFEREDMARKVAAWLPVTPGKAPIQPQTESFRFCSCHKNFHPTHHFRGSEKTCKHKAQSLRKSQQRWTAHKRKVFVTPAKPQVSIKYPPSLDLSALAAHQKDTLSLGGSQRQRAAPPVPLKIWCSYHGASQPSLVPYLDGAVESKINTVGYKADIKRRQLLVTVPPPPSEFHKLLAEPQTVGEDGKSSPQSDSSSNSGGKSPMSDSSSVASGGASPVHQLPNSPMLNAQKSPNSPSQDSATSNSDTEDMHVIESKGESSAAHMDLADDALEGVKSAGVGLIDIPFALSITWNDQPVLQSEFAWRTKGKLIQKKNCARANPKKGGPESEDDEDNDDDRREPDDAPREAKRGKGTKRGREESEPQRSNKRGRSGPVDADGNEIPESEDSLSLEERKEQEEGPQIMLVKHIDSPVASSSSASNSPTGSTLSGPLADVTEQTRAKYRPASTHKPRPESNKFEGTENYILLTYGLVLYTAVMLLSGLKLLTLLLFITVPLLATIAIVRLAFATQLDNVYSTLRRLVRDNRAAALLGLVILSSAIVGVLVLYKGIAGSRFLIKRSSGSGKLSPIELSRCEGLSAIDYERCMSLNKDLNLNLIVNSPRVSSVSDVRAADRSYAFAKAAAPSDTARTELELELAERSAPIEESSIERSSPLSGGTNGNNQHAAKDARSLFGHLENRFEFPAEDKQVPSSSSSSNNLRTANLRGNVGSEAALRNKMAEMSRGSGVRSSSPQIQPGAFEQRMNAEIRPNYGQASSLPERLMSGASRTGPVTLVMLLWLVFWVVKLLI